MRGYAQQNALTIFPLKNWPYVVPWPSPPMHGFHMNEPRWLPPMSAGGTDFWTVYVWPCNSYRWWDDTEDLCYPWETAHIADPAAVGDPDVQKVFDWPESDQRYGYFPYACGRLYQNGDQPATNFGRPPEARRWDNQGDPAFPDPSLSTGTAPTRDACIRYVQAAAWYCMRKVGNDPSWWAPSDTTDPQGLVGGGPEPWKQVQAMRFLSHAATCLTSWYPLDDGTQPEDLKRGVTIPMVTLGGVAGPADFKITHDLVVWYHERAMKTVMEYCAKYPYDWGTPRPAQRTIMTDHPLLQYDLFSPPLQGSIVGTTPAVPAKQWRPISPRPIRNFGLSFTYPAMPTDPTMVRGGSFPPASDLVHSTQDGSLANRWGAGAMFGDIDHYTLTAPFEAFHRCREIVFWAADWQSFEDFETCPSAPVDASKYPLSAPREDAWDYWGQGTHLVHNIWDRMIDMQFRDEQLWAYRNPEKTLLFWPKDGVDPRTLPTGTDMTERMILNNPFIDPFSYPDYGPDETRRRTFNGLYGADRNFNKRLDRGPLPTSARIRATTVARFNFYDPRLVCVTR